MGKKLYVICGHGHGDSGAVGGGKTEADLVRKLAKKMEKCNPNVVVLDTSRNWYADKGVNAALKKKVGGNPVVELHMDSAGASARGGHVIVCAGLSADKYDKALAKYVSKEFPGRASSIVKRDNLVNPKRAKANGINYRLLECCFISNKGDREKFVANMGAIAKGIVGCFGLAAAKPEAKPAPASYKIVVSDGVNVRKGAGTNHAKTGKAYAKGKTVSVKETKAVGKDVWGKTVDGWFAIKYGGKTFAKKA